MKKLLFIVTALLSVSNISWACRPERTPVPPGGGIFPQICYVYGPVNIKPNNHTDLVEGTIGGEDVAFAFYENYIYGNIAGIPVEMYVQEDGVVNGKMGAATFKLHVSHGRIVGCMPCIGPREVREDESRRCLDCGPSF